MSETENRPEENRPEESGFDRPIADPSDDLLDMDRQARALARYVRDNAAQRPFTVAIFGEWGEGKTTLVRLLKYYLEHPDGQAEKQTVNFVWFSSWAYNTTEKLWRALVLEIASVLYKQKKEAGDKKTETDGSNTAAVVEKQRDAATKADADLKPDAARDNKQPAADAQQAVVNAQQPVVVEQAVFVEQAVVGQHTANVVQPVANVANADLQANVANAKAEVVAAETIVAESVVETTDAEKGGWVRHRSRLFLWRFRRGLSRFVFGEGGAEKASEAVGDGDLSGKVSRFLAGDAFVLRKPAPVEDDDARYRRIVQSLESTDYGQVRQGGAQLDEGAALNAMLRGAVAALSTASPLVAGVSWLFGLDSKINTDELLKKQAEASQAQVNSLQGFQNIFSKILKERGNEEPVYIFVDDLDRALPDVALDIVESIRIALYNADCVFIIAIDPTLISEGLRARFLERYAGAQEASFKDKGQEYIEKIIQFGVRLPTRTSEQVQRFISAQFPEWTAASDLIELVAGTNPRRVKQYCQHLTFQTRVGPIALSQARRRSSVSSDSGGSGGGGGGSASVSAPVVGLTADYLIRKLIEEFDQQEVKAIAKLLDIELTDGTHQRQAAELVAKCHDRGKIKELRDHVESVRPRIFADDPDNQPPAASK